MAEIKDVMAKNLLELRKASSLTQMELAEKLNYSDKSVSKWEHGDAVPDIEVIARIAEFYGVTVDYLISEHTDEQEALEAVQKARRLNGNKLVITMLAISAVWIISTILYVQLLVWAHINYWLAFVWSVPVSVLVMVIFNAIWGRKRFSLTLISVFMWSILVGVYLELFKFNIWPMFIIGIPIQIAFVIASRLKKGGVSLPKMKKKEKAKGKSEEKEAK